MTPWGTCGSCYWFHNNRTEMCRDKTDPEHQCSLGFFRPRKLRGKAKRKTRGKAP
jgi:hypothetical protein